MNELTSRGSDSFSRRDLLWQVGGGLGGVALAAMLGRDDLGGAEAPPKTVVSARGGVVDVMHFPPKATRVVLGVDNIQRHRLPMLKRLQDEMPRLGFVPQTPLDSTSPIVTFAHRDTRRVAERLQAAKVNVHVAPTWVRIAPSVYNDMADIERLLDVLA